MHRYLSALLASLVTVAAAAEPSETKVDPLMAPNFHDAFKASVLKERPALDDLRKEADAGVPLAVARWCAIVTAKGKEIGVPAADGIAYCRRLADKDVPIGNYLLGLAYYNGWGVETDEPRSVELLRLAAQRQHPGAMSALALAYANGRGVAQDSAEALRWYRQAAEKGESAGMVGTGIAYWKG